MTNIYPTIEEDISPKVNALLETVNATRIKFAKDFISELNKDFIKYGNKKRRYSKIKNTLIGIDTLIGTGLFASGLATEILTLGSSTVLSVALSGVGAFMVTTIPLSNKLTDVACNKNRNLESLALRKLTQGKAVFSKSIDDGELSHEEFLEIVNCKTEYYEAKNSLKAKNQKEVEELFTNLPGKTNIQDYKKMKKKLEKLEKLKSQLHVS